MKTFKHQKGISLVELMTTVSIISLTLTFGVPTFSGSRASVQRGQVMLDLADSFSLARSEAARQGVSVRVCPSDTGLACSDADKPDWSRGWIVFTDINEDGLLDAGTDQMVHTARFSAPGFTLTPDGPLVAGVLFGDNGSPSVTGDFTYCDPKESRTYALGFVGRVEHVSTGAGCQ